MYAHRSGLFIPPYHATYDNPFVSYQRDLELVEYCEKLGFDEAWYGEHYSGGMETIASPEIMIAAAAERTKNIRLGTGVISLPYHDPLNVAHRIVQVDYMTKGRAMFGFGSGSLVHDATMRGIDPTTTRDRLAEAIDVVVRLLHGETVTHKTDWFNLVEASLHVPPYTDPVPEMVLAANNTPSGGRLAGKYGMGMICLTASQSAGYDALQSNWQIANEAAAENGHRMDLRGLRLVAPVHIAETRDQARANVRGGVERFLDYSFSLTPSKRERAAGLDPIDVITEQRGGIVGTPDDVIALIERFEAKVGNFGCFLHLEHDWADWEQTKRSYELYARYVVPRMRGWDARRAGSLQMFKDHETEIDTAKKTASAMMFEKHRAEQEKKKNRT